MKMIRNNGLIPVEETEITKAGKYSPGETQRVRKATLSDVVRQQYEILFGHGESVNLRDLEGLQRVSENYVRQCIECGNLPSFQGLSAVLGVSRSWLYEYLGREEVRQSEPGKYLDRLRSAFTAMRIAANERGAVPDATTIFLLKNSGQAYTDTVQIAPVQPQSPLASLDAVEARKRIMEGLPDDDMGDDV